MIEAVQPDVLHKYVKAVKKGSRRRLARFACACAWNNGSSELRQIQAKAKGPTVHVTEVIERAGKGT